MTIYCGCTVCEFYDAGKCAQVYSNTPACEVEAVLFDLKEVE